MSRLIGFEGELTDGAAPVKHSFELCGLSHIFACYTRHKGAATSSPFPPNDLMMTTVQTPPLWGDRNQLNVRLRCMQPSDSGHLVGHMS